MLFPFFSFIIFDVIASVIIFFIIVAIVVFFNYYFFFICFVIIFFVIYLLFNELCHIVNNNIDKIHIIIYSCITLIILILRKYKYKEEKTKEIKNEISKTIKNIK